MYLNLHSRFPYSNGGSDAWVDVGNKRVGVQVLQSYLGIAAEVRLILSSFPSLVSAITVYLIFDLYVENSAHWRSILKHGQRLCCSFCLPVCLDYKS